MSAPLFITARFRTGSTLLWNLFKQIPSVVSYWEPLHEQLPSFVQYGLSVDPTHQNVHSYFDEYKDCLELDRYHKIEFGVCRLLLDNDYSYPELKSYFDYLIQSANREYVVLQCNRICFRLPWIRKHYPESKIVHLYRSPRDQWISTVGDRLPSEEEAIDIEAYRLTTWAKDLAWAFPFLAKHRIRHAYQRHYYLWKLSYLAGARQADLSLAYEDILQDSERQISNLIQMLSLELLSHADVCRAILGSNRIDRWKDNYSEEWFADLEGECERVLDETGLNEWFGLKPVREIIPVGDMEDMHWIANHSNMQAIELQNQLDEKERVIQSFAPQVHELHAKVNDLQWKWNNIKTLGGLWMYEKLKRLFSK